jgi:YVTN family beta-propeller protein
MARRARRTAALTAAAALAVPLALTGVASASQAPPVTPGTQRAIFVGNNWDGTTDVVDPQTFQRLKRIDVVPDREERMAEIQRDPVRLAFFLAIREFIGEGNDQLNDDVFTSHDGRFMYVSRPSFADVVSIDLDTEQIVWRIPVEGQRSDHMGISPDGSRLLVSDSTERKVQVIDPVAGEVVGSFESGDTPHENNYTKDGSRIFHASIGMVYTPADRPLLDSTKGDRYFQVVDAASNEVLTRLDIGQVADESGFADRDLSSAVRPMAISPDEKTAYLQLSFHHGFVELDLESEKITRVADLPLTEASEGVPREQYLLDSAHHGLAINPEGAKLCAAGTMSDYAAIVHVDDFSHTLASRGSKPYWSTNSADGTQCYVSYSGDDEVAVIDYATEKEVARFPVGDHPQRVRNGVIRTEFLQGPPTAAPPAGVPAGPPAAAPAVQERGAVRRLAATGNGLAVPGALLLVSAAGAVAVGRRRLAARA